MRERRDAPRGLDWRIYSSRVQITDPSPPTLSAPSGALWADGYHRGVETVQVGASDNTGIRASRLRVDGFERGAAVRACDFTVVVPCSNEPGATIAFDTRAMTDGPHQLSVVAEDAALNVASLARTIVVDNGAPAAPADVTLEGPTGPQDDEQLHRALAQPGRSGRADRRGALDHVPTVGNAGAWRAATSGAGIAELAALQVPGAGDWDLRIWLQDAAGNATRAGSRRRCGCRWPRRRWDGTRGCASPSCVGAAVCVTVTGSTAVARGRVTVSVERRIGARTVRVRGAVTARDGRFSRRLRLRGRLARVKRVQRRGADRRPRRVPGRDGASPARALSSRSARLGRRAARAE